MGHTIIEVPAMAGDPNHPAAAGPATITAALHDTGCELPVHRVAVEAWGRGMVEASIELGTQLKELVGAIIAGGNVPVVLAGSCDVAPAVLAGISVPSHGRDLDRCAR